MYIPIYGYAINGNNDNVMYITIDGDAINGDNHKVMYITYRWCRNKMNNDKAMSTQWLCNTKGQ